MISRFQETLLITFCPLSRGMPSVEKKIKKKQNKTKRKQQKIKQYKKTNEQRKEKKQYYNNSSKKQINFLKSLNHASSRVREKKYYHRTLKHEIRYSIIKITLDLTLPGGLHLKKHIFQNWTLLINPINVPVPRITLDFKLSMILQ